MPDITAAKAARSFSALLDAVEQRGERFTIVSRGRAIARLTPATRGRGAEVKALLRRYPPDAAWTADVIAMRAELGSRGTT